MIISNKFIFVRIPRTASSSMEEFLKDYHEEKYDEMCNFSRDIRLSHTTIKTLKSDILDGKIKFAFVRNPFDRLVSFYHYYKKTKYKKTKNFREFILKYLVGGEVLSTRSFWFNQSCWLTDESGKIIVDHIGRFENLEKDFKKICKMINVPHKPLPWLKKSKPRLHYTKYYDSELIKIVRKKCRKDLKLFGYKYGEN